MAINIFEGARRIIKLATALWVAGWIVAAFIRPMREWPDGVGIAVLGLVFIFGFSWATGWIVRGFLGVPSGQDHK